MTKCTTRGVSQHVSLKLCGIDEKGDSWTYLCTWKMMREGCGKDYSKGLSMYVENDVGRMWEGLQQGPIYVRGK